MPKKAGMEQWKKSRRQAHLEQRRDRYYIFCEGQRTEPNYFTGFKRAIESHPLYRNMVLIEIQGVGAETLRVLEEAERFVRANHIENGQIWCVYDKDSFPDEDFDGVITRMELLNAQNPKIQFHAGWSNECIEFWFILHFEYYRSNNHRLEYIQFLDERFRRLGLGRYRKNMMDIFQILTEKGNPRLAIRYSDKIKTECAGRKPSEIAPGTNIDELVVELAKYLPDQWKAKYDQ